MYIYIYTERERDVVYTYAYIYIYIYIHTYIKREGDIAYIMYHMMPRHAILYHGLTRSADCPKIHYTVWGI